MTKHGSLADLGDMIGGTGEAAKLKQELLNAAREAKMVRVVILKRISMGWFLGLPGQERELDEAQLAIIEKELPGHLRRLDVKATPAAADTQELDRDVPGAPPPGAKDRKLTTGNAVRKRRGKD